MTFYIVLTFKIIPPCVSAHDTISYLSISLAGLELCSESFLFNYFPSKTMRPWEIIVYSNLPIEMTILESNSQLNNLRIIIF